MSVMPLHVQDFEVRSPNVKYGCAFAASYCTSTTWVVRAPPKADRRRGRRLARSADYIESTYEYQTTDVVKEGGKAV